MAIFAVFSVFIDIFCFFQQISLLLWGVVFYSQILGTMIERFLERNSFESYDDFMQNFKVKVPQNFNFGYDVVDAWAQEAPDKPALLWTNDKGEERTFTFADIKRESDRTAAFFQRLGIGRGDMVMLILKRHYQFWFSIIALHKLGAVAIPATHLLTPKDIVYRCERAAIKAIVCAGDNQIVEHIQNALPDCPSVKVLVSTGPVVPDGWHHFNTGIEMAPEFHRPAEPVNTNDDISLMYFTSGTTGEPKMVAHDFTYPLGHIVTARCWQNLDETSRHLTLADTGWGKAVWGKLYGQWICGAEVFVYDYSKFKASDLLEMMSRYRITSFCAPPTVFRFMILEDVARYDLSDLRYCTIAGEALNPNVFEEWKRLTGLNLMEGFGQTETTLTVANYLWMTPKPGSMGRPGPQYPIMVMDADGNEAKDDEEGEIVISLKDGKPLGLFKEYLKDPQANADAIHDGYYHTGDVAKRDKDGYLWFVGRIDDVIKSSGYRIGPFEVESALMTHPAVVECAVTGVPDPIRGQIIKATVVLAKEYRDKAGDSLVKEIQNHVKNITAPYKYPRLIEFVESLPKTISGKIRHAAIRADYLSRNNPEAEPTADEYARGLKPSGRRK